ncbi:hypothetical protein QF021_001515 [Acidovorax delafieldii]|nr:hypothetical protein [Acidovorax delafieldii]
MRPCPVLPKKARAVHRSAAGWHGGCVHSVLCTGNANVLSMAYFTPKCLIDRTLELFLI